MVKEADFQGKLIANPVPDYVDFGRNPYHDDDVDVFDVFTDMLITPTKTLLDPTGKKEDMTLTATCSLWKKDSGGGPPMPCGAPLYVGPVGKYPDATGVEDREWKKGYASNPNHRKRMRSTAKNEDGLGGLVCQVPVAYHIEAERLGPGGEPVSRKTPEFNDLWRSLVSVDKEGSITVSSLQKDVCLPGTTRLNPLLFDGVELTVTPYLWRPLSPPSDYDLRTQRALAPVKLKLSWTWISYSPTLLTAILGQREDHDDNYYMRPFVSPSLAKYRKGGDETAKRIEAGQREKRDGKGMLPFYYGSGFAWGYNLTYSVETDTGRDWPYKVTVDEETGIVSVAAPKATGHRTNIKAKGNLVVSVKPEGSLTSEMGFPRTFPIEIEWMTPSQWYKGVNDDAARGAGNPAPTQGYPTTPGPASVNSGKDTSANPDTGGCAQPQPPLGVPDKFSAEVAQKFNDLAKPSCYTANVQAGGQVGWGAGSAAMSATVAAGCEQIVAQMSNFNSFNQALACQFNNVQNTTTAVSDIYQKIHIKIGRDFMNDGGTTKFENSGKQTTSMKASLRSVNQQTLSAVTANAIKSQAKSKIKWANGPGTTPHGSKSIKQLTQNANQVTSSQNINKVMQSTFGAIYSDQEIKLDVGRDFITKNGGLTEISNTQQQALVVTSFVKQAMGSTSSSVMNNQVTDSLVSDVTDESKSVFDGVSNMIGAAQAGAKWIIGGIVIVVIFVCIGGAIFTYYNKFAKEKSGKNGAAPPKESREAFIQR